MKGLKCNLVNFLKKTYFSWFFVALVSVLFGSLLLSSDANAVGVDIGNPQVSWTRQYTTQTQYPTITTTSSVSTVPFNLATGADILIEYFNARFDVSGEFNQYTTVSGGFTISFGALSGGDMTNTRYIIELESGENVEGRMPIYSNHLSDSTPYIVYYFNVTLPSNAKIKHINYRMGNYCDGGTSCVIPLGGGPVILQSLWAHIETANDAGTDAVISEIGELNDTILNQTTMLNNTITFQEEQTRDAINNPQWVQDQNEATQDAYDDAQDDLENSVDQQAINSKYSSLLSIIQNFVSAVTQPIVSTCILPIHLENFHNFGFYEVDLCHLSPPSGLSTVLNIIFIFFVLGLAYSALRSIIQMYKEVIDG